MRGKANTEHSSEKTEQRVGGRRGVLRTNVIIINLPIHVLIQGQTPCSSQLQSNDFADHLPGVLPREKGCAYEIYA